MRSSIASLLVLGRGGCGVGEELFSIAGGGRDSDDLSSFLALTVGGSVASLAPRSAMEGKS